MNRFSPKQMGSRSAEPGTMRDAAGTTIGILWREKWIIGAFILASLAIAILYLAFIAETRFTSSARVVLDARDTTVVSFESVVSGIAGDKASVNTEVEIMRSPVLAGKVVDLLGLMEDPEFNARLRPEPLVSAGAVMAFLGLDGASGAEPTQEQIRHDVVKELLKALRITNIRDSYVFIVEIETLNAAKSAAIVNSFAELYVEEQLLAKFEATERATSWLTDRVAELKIELESSENAVKNFRTDMELITTDALEATNRQLKSFRARRDATELASEELQRRVIELEAARATGNIARMALVADDRVLEQLARDIGDDPVRRETFLARFDDLTARAGLEIERQRLQRADLERSITEIEAEVEAQSRELVTLEQLEREAEANRLIYEYFLSRLKETTLQQGIQQADSRVMAPGVEPLRRSKPRSGLILMLAGVLGLITGAAAGIARDARRTGFMNASDLENATGISVIGQIPKAPHKRRKSVLQYLISTPDSMMAEGVRDLRTSLLLSQIDTPPKVIMLTSSLPGEGKTTLSLSLSTNLARMGKRVLTIESDIRRRTFSEYFTGGERPGLVSAVTGAATLEDAVYHHPELGMDILMGEKSDLNAADFFSSDRFSDFIRRARTAYDFVVIDTPPVLIVPDARVIAPSADTILLVVRWNSTGAAPVRRSIESFESINLPVNGLCLSQIDPKGNKDYGYYGKYGSSRYYGSNR